MTSRKAPQLRRIVTTAEASGKSVLWMDGLAANHKFPNEHASSTLIWSTDRSPAPFTGDEDAGARILGTAPPDHGTRFAVVELQPNAHVPDQHRTDTLDYVICMAGEVTMYIDDGKVEMKAGDVMVQRGTSHAWANHGSEIARIAFVLIDGEPKREGSLHGTVNAR
ncbi:cupin domain-containing protein [Variovorax paradoxus]|uniref:cupin domain-containing protein n=1 Tax=Variovorax paradoxus TaxID=34073 RepID=UPI00102D1DEA|nr:cupin domain-containing protein [Variovorax paradoxus]